MVAILAELEMTQALIKLKFSVVDTSSSSLGEINKQQLFNDIYKEFEISEDEFNTSLAYYCERPKELEEMYGLVINNLSEREANSH